VIDAHAHVWALDARFPWQPSLASVSVPRESATVDDLRAEMATAGVSGAVLVQPAAYGWDNRYLAQCLATDTDHRFTGVCLVDPRSEKAPVALRRWTCELGFHGLRINLIDEPGLDWLTSAAPIALLETASALATPLLVQPLLHQIEPVARLAESHPALTVVVDYLGPDAGHSDAGRAAVSRLARVPNVVLKLLSVPADSLLPFPHRDLVSLYRAAIDQLGPGRILLGSDFPYVRSQLPYRAAIAWLRSDVCDDDRAVLADADATARRLWPALGAARTESTASGGAV
jgi:predicted TIM-barrel fold metal-dependent hydrolase